MDTPTTSGLARTDKERRQRRQAFIPGVLAAVTGIPLVASQWAPNWFLAGWVLSYLAVSAIGVYRLVHKTGPGVDQFWSTSVGTLFAALPISLAVWGDVQEHQWLVFAITTLYVATEANMGSLLRLKQWPRGVGQAIVATVIVIAVGSSIALAAIAALALVGILGPMIRAQQENQRLRDDHRQAVEDSEHSSMLAVEDPLTGVLNRRGVTTLLNECLDKPTSLLMFDADHFKALNDRLGYQRGDEILLAITRALAERLGTTWTVGRIGGDEFVAIAPGILEVDESVVAPVHCRLSTGAVTSVELSAGLTHLTKPTPGNEALRRVAFALRQAKHGLQPSKLVAFDSQLRSELARSQSFAASFAASIADGRVFAVAQPIVQHGRIVGVELLVRWRQQNGSIAMPSDFLPVLAAHGLMRELNEFMLRTGIAFAARFNDLEAGPFVSVNINASHVGVPELAASIQSLLQDNRVPPHRLMIEITESEGLHHLPNWERSADAFRRMGVLLAIDDFGSGYSSIERMNSLPITHLKFDRSLTRQLHQPLRHIVSGVVKFAAETGVGIIAEGIESGDDAAAMQSIGIHTMQGYYFSRPVELDVAAASVWRQDDLRVSAKASAPQRG